MSLGTSIAWTDASFGTAWRGAPFKRDAWRWLESERVSMLSGEDAAVYARLLEIQWRFGGIPADAETRVRVVRCRDAARVVPAAWPEIGPFFEPIAEGVLFDRMFARPLWRPGLIEFCSPGYVAPTAEQRRRDRIRAARGRAEHTEGEWLAMRSTYARCLACGVAPAAISELTKDHVVPVALGGSDDVRNLQPLCRRCNSRKGAKARDYRAGLPETRSEWMPMEATA